MLIEMMFETLSLTFDCSTSWTKMMKSLSDGYLADMTFLADRVWNSVKLSCFYCFLYYFIVIIYILICQMLIVPIAYHATVGLMLFLFLWQEEGMSI